MCLQSTCHFDLTFGKIFAKMLSQKGTDKNSFLKSNLVRTHVRGTNCDARRDFFSILSQFNSKITNLKIFV